MIDTFDAVSNIDLFLRCSSSFKLSFGVLSPPKSNCIEEWPFSTQQPSHILMRQRKLREEKKNFNFLWQNRQKHFAELSEKLWKLRRNLKNKAENRLTGSFSMELLAKIAESLLKILLNNWFLWAISALGAEKCQVFFAPTCARSHKRLL